jgi:hypothetical protein
MSRTAKRTLCVNTTNSVIGGVGDINTLVDRVKTETTRLVERGFRGCVRVRKKEKEKQISVVVGCNKKRAINPTKERKGQHTGAIGQGGLARTSKDAGVMRGCAVRLAHRSKLVDDVVGVVSDK